MSTFFEKLTGARPKGLDTDPVATLASSRSIPRRSPSTSATARPERAVPPPPPLPPGPKNNATTHLKIENGEEAKIPAYNPTPEPLIEEEGELTVDIYDKGDAIVIQSTVAGVKPEDLDVSITNDSVTIHGKREQNEEVSEEHYYYKELFWGSFSRSVILPEEIEDDMAEASLKHGLLTIHLPKKQRGVVQKLKVKVT